jgi:O-antigen ligase
MYPKSIFTAIKYVVEVFFLFLLLFADGIWATSPGFIGFALREFNVVCRDSATQWMLVLCLTVYFFVFLVSESRERDNTPHLRPTNPNVWLAALVLLSLLKYVLAYDTASHSIQMLVLMAGIVFGKSFAAWARWRSDEIERRAVFLIRSLACLLAVSTLWQSAIPMIFQYHGIPRWIGVWDNPNLYGLLMGVGFVLASGQIAGARRWKMEDGRWRKILCAFLFLFATILCGLGLFKSYSRGAWLAVFAGLIYLVVQTIRSSRFSAWFDRNRLPLALLLASLMLLVFWQFRFSELRPVQRIFSAANANDFSWRNRVTAWEGAARMMVDRPWAGFGWGQAEMDYGKIYCPSRLNESAGIQMNDYLMIGISSGVPALFCFVAYLMLSFRKQATELRCFSSISHPPVSIFTVCRSGAIVLLVGFLVRWRIVQATRCDCVLDAHGTVPC